MSKPIPLSGGRKILPSREDLERQPFSFFASGKKRTSAAASAKYDLSGLILDDEGDPISGVTVTLSGDADSSVVTGVDGAFLFEDLSKGDYTVTPSRASFVFTPASRSVTQLAEDTALDSFEGVGSIYIISGTITGDEVENVTVTLSGDDNDEVITGADGTYSFSGLADGDYTVTPSLDGYGFTPAATNVTINNADQTGKDFVSALLVYDISGAITGDEVEGVTVALTGDSSDSVVTGVGGTFTFADLPPGDYTLTPTLAGYTFAPASINVTIVAADQTDQDFVSTLVTHVVSGTVTQATYDISGLIVDGAAAGIEGVTVTLTGDASDSTTTDSNGAYSFTGLDSGSYTVTPTYTGVKMTPTSRAANVSGDDVAVDNIVAQYVLLPYTQTFDSFDTGAVKQADGFYRIEGSAGIAAVAAAPQDSNSYSVPGASKALLLSNGTTYHTTKAFPLVESLESGLNGIRLAILYYSTNGGGSPFQTVSVDTYEGNGDSNSINNLKAQYGVAASNNAFFYQFVVGGSVTQSFNKGSSNATSSRWMWVRSEITTAGQHDMYWVRAEDATTIDSRLNDSLALAAVLQCKYMGIIWNSTEPGDCYIAKLWIGSLTDDWPT